MRHADGCCGFALRMGQWFSGNWLDGGAQNYISDVQSILASKPWLDPNF